LGDAACTTKNGDPWSYKTGEGSITRRFDQQEFVPEMSGTAHHFILLSRGARRFHRRTTSCQDRSGTLLVNLGLNALTESNKEEDFSLMYHNLSLGMKET
jgi:hypothetical protein